MHEAACESRRNFGAHFQVVVEPWVTATTGTTRPDFSWVAIRPLADVLKLPQGADKVGCPSNWACRLGGRSGQPKYCDS